jgi:hypothetical protein
MTEKEKKINYISSTIRNSDFTNNKEVNSEEYLSMFSEIICQFDTDIAIGVMENLSNTFGNLAKNEARSIKIRYGY